MNSPWMLLPVLAIAAAALWSVFKKPPTDYMPPMPTKERTDLEYWYYGLQPGEIEAIRGHVTMVHESEWYGGDAAVIESMQAHGMPTMLNIEPHLWNGSALRPDAAALLGGFFMSLRSAGVLGNVVALYMIDEPDGKGCAAGDVLAACALARQVAERFPELAGVKLACTYSYKRILPGIEGMDWVGLDDYGAGSGVLIGDAWSQLMARLRPDQRCYVVPGGAAPWHQDPEAFRRWAHATPQCMGIMAFMWGPRTEADGVTYQGIDTSAVKPEYIALGTGIVNLRRYE